MADEQIGFPFGKPVLLPGHFDVPVTLEHARQLGTGYECRVRLPDGTLVDPRTLIEACPASHKLPCIEFFSWVTPYAIVGAYARISNERKHNGMAEMQDLTPLIPYLLHLVVLDSSAVRAKVSELFPSLENFLTESVFVDKGSNPVRVPRC